MFPFFSQKDEKMTLGLLEVCQGAKVMLYLVLSVTEAKQTLVRENPILILNSLNALIQVIYLSIELNLSQGILL